MSTRGMEYTSPNLSAERMDLLSGVIRIEQGRLGIVLDGCFGSEYMLKAHWLRMLELEPTVG